MDFSYAVTPFIAWVVAGTLKFGVNSIRGRRLAFAQVGYGGLPSNHSAIVGSATALIAFKEGIGSPAFGVAIGLTFIVLLDANSLRRQVGKHAAAINRLHRTADTQMGTGEILRERMGHTYIEIAAGLLVGIAVAACVAIAC